MYISIQDLEKTDFQNNMFDYITSLSVIEHGVNHLAYYQLRKKLEGVPDEFKGEYIRPRGQVKWRIIFHADSTATSGLHNFVFTKPTHTTQPTPTCD